MTLLATTSFVVGVSLCLANAATWATDPLFEHVTYRRDNEERTIFGRTLARQHGGILLEASDQRIWLLQPDEIVSRTPMAEAPSDLTTEQLAERVLAELPEGFQVHTTAHYVICYNTSSAYAQWCGALFERLHRAFYNYWSRRRLELRDTPPLVALVFRDKQSYEAYGRKELADSIDSILGFYSFETNRITMYNLVASNEPQNATQINQLLRRERTVATVIHEATHQIAFNCGLHQRYADIPLWLSEGLAIFFETPDLQNARGWTTIGDVNQVRLAQFRDYCHQRPDDSLWTLVVSNERFRSSEATSAYAESWSFCYYLIRNHPNEFAEYLRILQRKPPLEDISGKQRIQDFRQAFGVAPSEMEIDFRRKMGRVR